MFRKSERKKKFLPFVLFRMFLSLIMLVVLSLLVYQALIYFSGNNEKESAAQILAKFKTNPQGTIISLLTASKPAENLTRFLGLNLPKDTNQVGQQNTSQKPQAGGKLAFRFAVVADSHNENNNLSKALKQTKDSGAKFVIGLGDYTDTGTISELQAAKDTFEASGLPYYLTAGDHDLWDSRDKKLPSISRFSEVFGSAYQSFIDSNIRFVLVCNADNYVGVDDLQMGWLKETLSEESTSQLKTTFVFLHEALMHPSSDRFMGSPHKDEGETGNKIVAGQAQTLIEMFKKAGVAEVFAGDIHAYSRYEDPKTGLKMITAGALTRERNLQPPRFLMVDVFENGSYNVLDTELK